jgi:integrase
LAEGEPFFLVDYNSRAAGDPDGNPEINSELDYILILFMRIGLIDSIHRFEFDGASYTLVGQGRQTGSIAARKTEQHRSGRLPWKAREIPNGVYYIHRYESGKPGADGKARRRTKRLSLSTTEASAAQAAYALFLLNPDAYGKAEAPSSASAALTVSQALDDYWNEYWVPKLKEEDRRDKDTSEYYAIPHLKAFMGDRPVVELTDDDIKGDNGFIAAKRAGKRGLGRRAGSGWIARELSVLVAAINHEVAKKRLKADEAPSIYLPPQPEPRDRWLRRTPEPDGRPSELVRALSITETPKGKLTRACRFRWLAYYTAGRRAAILELTQSQVDLEANVIRLNPRGRVQNKKRRPIVPIDSELRPLLERILKEIKTEYLFDHPGSVRTALDSELAAVELYDVSAHVFRHSRATHLLQDGTNPYAVAGLLGDTLETVMRVYGHHCPEHIRREIEKTKRPQEPAIEKSKDP